MSDPSSGDIYEQAVVKTVAGFFCGGFAGSHRRIDDERASGRTRPSFKFAV